MGGHPGYILYYTKKVQSDPAPRTYLEAGTIADVTIYYIEISSAMSEKQFTDILIPQVMQIINSFKILHPIDLQSKEQQTETSQQEVRHQQIDCPAGKTIFGIDEDGRKLAYHNKRLLLA